MKILVIGKGAREHAVARALAKNEREPLIYVLPGNAGTGREFFNVKIPIDDRERILDFVKNEGIDLVFIGDEKETAEGLADDLRRLRVPVFAPSWKAAKLDQNRVALNRFFDRYKIPTSAHRTFDTYRDFEEGVGAFGFPALVRLGTKQRGDTYIVTSPIEALTVAQKMFLEDPNNQVILEEYIPCHPATVVCLVDNNAIIPVQTSREYYKGGNGLALEGLGAYSPNVLFFDSEERLLRRIYDVILLPILEGFLDENLNYNGILEITMAVDENGAPKVLDMDFNLDDLQASSFLPRLSTDFLHVVDASMNDQIDSLPIDVSDGASVSVVVADKEFPETPAEKRLIEGLEKLQGVHVHHNDTRLADDEVLSDGNRFITITATAPTIEEAKKRAYLELEKLDIDDSMYLMDVAEEV